MSRAARTLAPSGSKARSSGANGTRTARESAAARLQLVEALLTHDDVTECLDYAMEWCERTLKVSRAVCLGRPLGESVLRPLGSRGFTSKKVQKFTVSVDDHDNPLVPILTRRRTVLYPAVRSARDRQRRPVTPFGNDSFHVAPLRSGKMPDESIGLLIVDGQVAWAPEIDWFAAVLAQKLENLLNLPGTADQERDEAHERSLLHSIINAISDPILLTDTEGRMLLANTHALRLFTASEDESEGRRDAVRMNNMLLSAALSNQAIEEGGAMRRELTLVSPIDGSDLLFELLSMVTQDTRYGTGVVSILRNVSDLSHAVAQTEENLRKLRMAEAEARAERDRLDLVINSVADPIVVTDAGGSISMVNEPAERLFTTPPDAGGAVQRRVRTNDARFSSFVAGLLVGDDLRRVDNVSLVNPGSGDPMPVEAIAGKVLTAQGEMTAIVTILHDRREAIERGKLYEQLKEASAELERKVRAATGDIEHQNELLRQQAMELAQASSMKTQFLSNMSHEFRTPLNAILGYTSILQRGVAGKLNKEVNEQLERIASNGRNLLTIVNEILDISQIEAGRMPVRMTTFTLADMIEEVRTELEPIIRTAKLEAAIDVPEGLPRISTDRQKLKQILFNLLSNAVKFTPKGSVGIAVRRAEKPPTIQIDVTDTGIGIAPADQERIFDDFQQLDNSSTRPYSGTGLGLAICRRFARMIGGNISVSSRVGEGSTFTVTIPVERS